MTATRTLTGGWRTGERRKGGGSGQFWNEQLAAGAASGVPFDSWEWLAQLWRQCRQQRQLEKRGQRGQMISLKTQHCWYCAAAAGVAALLSGLVSERCIARSIVLAAAAAAMMVLIIFIFSWSSSLNSFHSIMVWQQESPFDDIHSVVHSRYSIAQLADHSDPWRCWTI